MFSEFSSCSFFCLHCRGYFTLQSNIISCYYTIIIYGYFSFAPCRWKSSFDEASSQEATALFVRKGTKNSFSEVSSQGKIHKTMCLIPMIRYSAPSLARGLGAIFAHSLLTKRLYDLQIWMFLSILHRKSVMRTFGHPGGRNTKLAAAAFKHMPQVEQQSKDRHPYSASNNLK